MLWPHTTWNWRSSRTSSDITVKWPLLPKSSSMHSRFRKCTTGTEIPCVSFCKVSWFLNDMWKNSKSENTHVTNNNNLGTRSSLEYRNNSDFPRDDVVKLFREQQASGRSKWCEKVVATVPTDEPKDQPPMFKWVLTVMILRDIKLCKQKIKRQKLFKGSLSSSKRRFSTSLLCLICFKTEFPCFFWCRNRSNQLDDTLQCIQLGWLWFRSYDWMI